MGRNPNARLYYVVPDPEPIYYTTHLGEMYGTTLTARGNWFRVRRVGVDEYIQDRLERQTLFHIAETAIPDGIKRFEPNGT